MDEDLIDLLAAWRGGDVEPARRDALLERLRRDEAFREAFAEEIRVLGMLKAVQSTEPRWAGLHEALGWGPEEGETGADLEDAIMRRIRALPSQRATTVLAWARRAAAATVLLLLGGWAALSWFPRAREAPVVPPIARPSPAGSADPLALAVDLDAVRWEPGEGLRPGPGAILGPGRLRLRSGRLTLSFFSGVTLALEGPADAELQAIDRVFCREGRLRARVPEEARGFVVASPSSAVVDLGTEFALNVQADGKARVMVFEGEAEAALLDRAGAPGLTRRVEQSQAFELDPSTGRIEEAEARPEAFLPAASPAHAHLIPGVAYPEAVTASRPLAYWRFESASGDSIPNEVPGGPPLRIRGPVRIVGVAEGNGHAAFREGSPDQCLFLDGPWGLRREPGHAVEFWFSPEGYGHSSLVGFYPPEDRFPPGHPSRLVHTLLVETTASERQSLNKPASVRYLHRWPLDYHVGTNLFSEGVYRARGWHHVVAQKDHDRIELYVDGALSHSVGLDPDHPDLACRLVVGRRAIDPDLPMDIRPFVGRLDELALYDRPLSPEEVRRHHQSAGTQAGP